MRSMIKGSYTQLKDFKGKLVNKWRIQLYTGRDPVTLKYKRHTEIVKGNEAEAKRRLKELSDTQDQGVPIPQGRITVAEHFNRFLDGYIKAKFYDSTYDEYKAIIDKHLNPVLGHIQLKQLQPQQIQNYYGKMRESLSGNTVNRHHRLLTQSFKYAVRQGYLGRNPCDIVDAPTIKKKAMRAMTPDEVEILMQKAEESYYYPVIYTAVHTGLRRAELLGLRWRDINLDETTISINQVLKKHRGASQFKEPKTNHSRRRLGMTPKLVLFLREYKRSRENLYLERGQILGLDSLVFAHQDGTPLDPSVLSHEFNKIVKRAGLKDVRFHDLRHTFASLMLLKGVNIKVISEALGHASVAFTMDIYSHIMKDISEDAMTLLNEVLPVGVLRN